MRCRLWDGSTVQMSGEHKAKLTPMYEWLYNARATINSTRPLQRVEIFLDHATIPGVELHRHDNQLVEIPISIKSKELLYNMIRLVALFPGSGNDVIECDISAYSFQDLPTYETLSYTWGKGPSHPILCNGQYISITESLGSALRRLRNSTSVRLLWIDALCINQEDIQERNSQVQYMRDIYHGCRNVVVWLGESSRTSSTGFSLVRDVALAASSESGSSVQKPITTGELTLKGLPERSSPSWRALGAIFWREWFARIWIIRGVSVPQSVVVVCGADTCSWSDMTRAAKYISDHSLDAITDVDPKLVMKLSDFRMRDDPQRPLLRLLSEARNSYATDARDKVYALLGLASDVDSLSLLPDYSQDASEVYTRMVKSWIQRDRNLDILSAVEDNRCRVRPGLPSWVPDWDAHVPTLPFSAHPGFTFMCAAGDSKATCTFGPDNKVLNARGKIIDSLDSVGMIFDEFIPASGTISRGSSMRDGLSRIRTRQWHIMAHKLMSYPTGENVESVFVQTLIGQVKLEPAISSDELRLCYYAWRQYFEVAHREHGMYIQVSHKELFTEDLARATYFMKEQQKAAYGRRFFTTKNGYMGLSPYSSRIGDSIVILLGGRTPFILRRTRKGGYRFIGECYVHGMMNGEGLGQNAEMQDFHIW
ncbi:HET domain containing protein [Hyaloscypha variabilis]